MATRPESFPQPGEQRLPPEVVRSGTEQSQLAKYQRGGSRIPEAKRGRFKELVSGLTPDQMGVVAGYLEVLGNLPPGEREEAGMKIVEIFSNINEGIISSNDPDALIKGAIKEIQQRRQV